MATVLDRILGVEGTSQNPRSSAVGPGQFINSTWLNMIQKYRPDLAEGRSRDQILALRTDPNYKALGPEMTAAYARENQGILAGAGYAPTPGNTYLAHFAGPGGAVKLLSADPNTPVSQILPSAVAANPFLANMTAKNAVDWAERKMVGAQDVSLGPSPSGPVRYGEDSPALGTPPVAPTPQGAPSPSPGPSSAPAGGGGLLGMITQALGITPQASPGAAAGIPAQAPQGYPQQPITPYEVPQQPPLEMPPFPEIQFAQQPTQVAPPRGAPSLLWQTRIPGMNARPPLRTNPYYPPVFGAGIRG